MLAGDGAGVLGALGACGGDPELGVHLRCAAYRLGCDVALPGVEEACDPAVRAYALATRGHAAWQEGDEAGGLELLLDAAAGVGRVSAGAAGRYVGEAAALLESREGVGEDGGGVARVVLALERAVEGLEGSGFGSLRGELLMTRARLLIATAADRGEGGAGVYQEAVRCYQRATQALPRRTHPVEYALCHLHVAVAYLSMPMSRHASRLRSAIAVQSLRESLEVFTADAHPREWEAATLNLANALQHLPSAHVAQNLEEAVSLYEGVLERRGAADGGRGRVLANMGNALAHLGRFGEAEARLGEALSVFRGVGDVAGVEGVTGVLGEVASRRAAAEGLRDGVGGSADG